MVVLRAFPSRLLLRAATPLVGAFCAFPLCAGSPSIHGIDIEASDVRADGVAERVAYLRELGVNAVRMADLPADARWREACAAQEIQIFAADEAPAFAFRLSDPGEPREVPSERLKLGAPEVEWVYTGRGRKRGILGPDGRPTARAIDARYVFSDRRAEIDLLEKEQREQMLSRIAATPQKFASGELTVSERLEISGPGFSLRFNAVRGLLESWRIGGVERLASPIRFISLRAPEDESEEVFGGETLWETDGSCTVVVPYFFSPSGRRAECRYTISLQGALKIDWKWMDGGKDNPVLILSMPLFPQNVSWQGRGPLPSRCAPFGKYDLPFSEVSRRVFADDPSPCLRDVGAFNISGAEGCGWKIRALSATFDIALELTRLAVHPRGFPIEISGR